MSNPVETYSSILDLGRETMTEGDYLKLATFLGDLHKTTEAIEVHLKWEEDVNVVFEFDTYKGKHYTLTIDKVKKTSFKECRKPVEEMVVGSLNGVAFEELENEFIKRWSRRFEFYGLKNIKRTIVGMETEEFENLRKFKTMLQCRIDDDRKEDVDEDDMNVDDYTDHYITRLLVGLACGC